MEEKLTLKNRRDLSIVGILTKPEEKDSSIIGTAILQHGYGSTKERKQLLAMQEAFLKNGFQVFNFDTTNSFGESDGEYKNARLGLHADDFEDVANWVQEQDWFTGKLLVSGHSMGGFASARYALKNFDKVDFVIPFAPVISGELSFVAERKFNPGILNKWKEYGVLFEKSKTVHDIIKEKPWNVVVEYFNHSLIRTFFEEGMKNSPILLIACEKDIHIPPEYIKIFYDALGDTKSFEIIDGASHSPKEKKYLNRLSEIIDLWLQEQLKDSC